MKIKITSAGVFDNNGLPLSIGTEITSSRVPDGWDGLCVVTERDPGEDAELIVNPADTKRAPKKE